ncbi:predicted protein [Nematostella vectensis]|uniref:Uncharacterized protein n=1 Tax=Nematostella vectensis TaxID=45351 RepID=A7RFC9_NEMVE|nr:predicted protein [Nematostella vectensis]|eukprot:XP_001642136.1 predicted protein [Nematostella vectensis]
MAKIVRVVFGIFLFSSFTGFIERAEARPRRHKFQLYQTSQSPIPHIISENNSHNTSPQGKVSHLRVETGMSRGLHFRPTPQRSGEELAVKKSDTRLSSSSEQRMRTEETKMAGLRSTLTLNKRAEADIETYDQQEHDPIIRPVKIEAEPPMRRSAESTWEILAEKTRPQDMESEENLISSKEHIGESSLSQSPWYKRSVKEKQKDKTGTIDVAKRESSEDYSNYDDFQESNSKKSDYGDGDEDEMSLYTGRHSEPASDDKMLKNLLDQGDGTLAFGTPQEAKEEDHLIKEIEDMSRQSAKLPKGLHLPYTNGPLDTPGTSFSNMDVSIGGIPGQDDSETITKYAGDKGENDPSYLKRDSILGHYWESRNRDIVPRQEIANPGERFPAIERFPSIEPPQLEQFRRLPMFPAIPPVFQPVGAPFREPQTLDEAPPLDEPPPMSEYLPVDEPAPISELPSIREIPPIQEPTHATPKRLDPKETFGNKKSKLKPKN